MLDVCARSKLEWDKRWRHPMRSCRIASAFSVPFAFVSDFPRAGSSIALQSGKPFRKVSQEDGDIRGKVESDYSARIDLYGASYFSHWGRHVQIRSIDDDDALCLRN
ncbi:hypothetical protein MTO96_014782 [Rhipicephalus appendiculatus]